jgi:hypothetical protein
MIQDFLWKIFGIHEEFAAREKYVFDAVTPPIKNKLNSSADQLSWQITLCLDNFPYSVNDFFLLLNIFISVFLKQ